MTKKLLQKTSRVYLLFSVLLLLVSAPLFYYIMEKLYVVETDETLVLHKNEFLKYSLPSLTPADIPTWNKYNRNVKIEPFNNLTNDTLFYTAYYDTLDAETEPYRELNAPISIEGKPYTYLARINLVETEDLMASIALLFLAIITFFLLGLFLITKKLSVKLWKPFYETLNKIERFEIDKSTPPKFPETTIEEFSRLNKSIEKLIVKNTSIYRSQREFVENAAHELQTPLAVFQAKIDNFVQSGTFTQEQYALLGSLNESVSRLSRLNKNLLLLSKMENDNYNAKQSLDFKTEIGKHFNFFTEQAEAKYLTISTNLESNVSVKANPVLTEILISNLFLNAIRHNVNNGTIAVTLTNQLLTFSNTGQPIPLVSDQLFNRFSKVTPSAQGNGLGLAIIKKIAELNNWTISYSYTDNLHTFLVKF